MLFRFFRNFSSVAPHRGPSQVQSQVATHQEIGSQLWARETPNSNPGLQDNSLMHYHWVTTPSYVEVSGIARQSNPVRLTSVQLKGDEQLIGWSSTS